MPKVKREVMVKEIQDTHFKLGHRKHAYQTTNQFFGGHSAVSNGTNNSYKSISPTPAKISTKPNFDLDEKLSVKHARHNFNISHPRGNDTHGFKSTQ